MDADDGRLLNAVLSAGLAGIFILLIWLRWDTTGPTRRCMWVGFVIIMAATSFGSLEAAFWDTTLRIGIFTAGVGVMYVGAIAELRDALHERRAGK